MDRLVDGCMYSWLVDWWCLSMVNVANCTLKCWARSIYMFIIATYTHTVPRMVHLNICYMDEKGFHHHQPSLLRIQWMHLKIVCIVITYIAKLFHINFYNTFVIWLYSRLSLHKSVRPYDCLSACSFACCFRDRAGKNELKLLYVKSKNRKSITKPTLM